MSRWRVAVVVVLVAVPWVFLAGVGSYYLLAYTTVGLFVWWGMALSMGLGYLLGWHWQRRKQLLRPVDEVPPVHWTDRDRQAWKLVEARGKAAAEIDSAKFTDLEFYLHTAQEMALELAQFYHPGSADPVGSLTIPEVLAVAELASHDLAIMVDEYLPGGHLLTINDWKRARQAVDYYQKANTAYWLISAVFAPVNTGLRFVASRFGVGMPMTMLQQNLLLWFFTAFVHRTGHYLIDLNSGRLRVGARRYRELVTGRQPGDGVTDQEVDRVGRVTLTLLGQVKAGKSSLANALLGEQRAKTDVLPMTRDVQRYELKQPGVPTQFVLQDTAGYAHTGPKADQIVVTREAAQQSDLLLLVLHARSPARQADLELLKGLRAWFASRPDLRMPPVLAVLTHIDLLSPAMEWQPPYDWQDAKRPKEENIRDAVAAVREQLGEYLVGVVPVCAAAGRVYGVEEQLLPAVAGLLDEVRAVAMLRCLRAEIDTGKVRKVFRQLLAAGKKALPVVWEGLAK